MNILLICCFLFLCGFSFFKKTDEGPHLPHSFTQKPVTFLTEEPKEIEKQLSLIAKKYSSQAIEWWILYKRALLFKEKDLNLFCKNMHFLSQIEAFPLRHYTVLNLYSFCSESVNMDLSFFPEWLKKKATEEWYKKAKSLNDTKEIMESSYQMYIFSKDKNLREQYLVTAIDLAKKIKDPRFQKWKDSLHILSPRYILKPTHSQKLAIANDFKYVRNFRKAIFYYRQILNNSRSSFYQKNEAFKKIRHVYKLRKNNKKYLLATLQWKNWLKRKMKKNKRAIHIYHNISYLLARTQWTLNQNTKALKTLQKIEKELGSLFSLFKVYRMKALIFNEKGDMEKSIYFFEKAFKEKYSDAEIWEKTQWSYAWTLKKIGRVKDNIAVLNNLLKKTESDYLPSRILFWIARSYESLKDYEAAEDIYEEIIEKDPLSYYGFLAHYKIKKPIYIDKIKKNSNIKEDNEEYIIAQWLLSLNEHNLALDFLNYKAKKYKADKNKKTKEWSVLFYYMAKARSYFPLFKMVGDLPVDKRTVFFRSYTDLMFPVIHTKAVEKAAQLFNIEKEFIYALIRQESAWNPKARSPADAFGLMQIRPFVARRVAKRNGLSYKNMYDLYEPQKNILIGTAFLKQLSNKYNSQFITTVAVYNAGRTAVLRWLKKIPYEEDPLSFIEEIPYEETRTYVRLLIRNIIFYKLLTHSERKISFPDWILDMQPLPQ